MTQHVVVVEELFLLCRDFSASVDSNLVQRFNLYNGKEATGVVEACFLLAQESFSCSSRIFHVICASSGGWNREMAFFWIEYI